MSVSDYLVQQNEKTSVISRQIWKNPFSCRHLPLLTGLSRSVDWEMMERGDGEVQKGAGSISNAWSWLRATCFLVFVQGFNFQIFQIFKCFSRFYGVCFSSYFSVDLSSHSQLSLFCISEIQGDFKDKCLNNFDPCPPEMSHFGHFAIWASWHFGHYCNLTPFGILAF